jgi:hypothetical protein
MERVALGDLPKADIGMPDTVVVPPARALQPDTAMRARLAALDLAANDA